MPALDIADFTLGDCVSAQFGSDVPFVIFATHSGAWTMPPLVPTYGWYATASIVFLPSVPLLFFDRVPPARNDNDVWTYDLRSQKKYSLRNNPLTSEDLT